MGFTVIPGRYCSRARADVHAVQNTRKGFPDHGRQYVYGSHVSPRRLTLLYSLPIDGDTMESATASRLSLPVNLSPGTRALERGVSRLAEQTSTGKKIRDGELKLPSVRRTLDVRPREDLSRDKQNQHKNGVHLPIFAPRFSIFWTVPSWKQSPE